MKKIAAITMARNDEQFLTKWMAYYSQQLGAENVYVFLDGKDQSVPAGSGKVNVVVCEKIEAQRAQFDKVRMAFLSQQAALLFAQGYQLVIGCDTDEFLVVDPALQLTLAQYLSQAHIPSSLSALGVDVGQYLPTETAIDWTKPFLQQRAYALLSTRYTKAVVLGKPMEWGSGFHRIKGHNFHIDPHLYLFHFGGFDRAYVEAKFLNTSLMQAGWKAHVKRRLQTTYIVSQKKALNGDVWMPRVRILQTYLRKPYAWNKPSLGWWKCVVRIPKRFQNIL
jgi:hypothetical protein